MSDRDATFFNPGDLDMKKVLDVTTDADLQAQLAKATGPVVLDFVQEDCGHCEEAKPHVDKLAKGCDVTVLRIDVEKADDGIMNRFGALVEGTPTTLYAPSAAEMTPEKAVEVDPEDKSFLKTLKCALPERKGKKP